MERVSYKVAKALKENGYPQNETEYRYTKEGNLFVPRNRGEDEKYSECDAPYVMDAWLWLWREKKIYFGVQAEEYPHDGTCLNDYQDIPFTDPEKAIASAIEHLIII